MQKWPGLLVSHQYDAHVPAPVLLDVTEQVDVEGETWLVFVLLTWKKR